MKMKIDNKSSIPIYFQIFDQIKHLVAIEDLKINERMPTIRELAIDLEINPNTVAKAYTELQREGIIETVQGVGTYVKNSKQILKPNERELKLVDLVNKFMDESSRFGFTKEDMIRSIKNY